MRIDLHIRKIKGVHPDQWHSKDSTIKTKPTDHVWIDDSVSSCSRTSGGRETCLVDMNNYSKQNKSDTQFLQYWQLSAVGTVSERDICFFQSRVTLTWILLLESSTWYSWEIIILPMNVIQIYCLRLYWTCRNIILHLDVSQFPSESYFPLSHESNRTAKVLLSGLVSDLSLSYGLLLA